MKHVEENRHYNFFTECYFIVGMMVIVNFTGK
jgi:hypothetical protein